MSLSIIVQLNQYSLQFVIEFKIMSFWKIWRSNVLKTAYAIKWLSDWTIFNWIALATFNCIALITVKINWVIVKTKTLINEFKRSLCSSENFETFRFVIWVSSLESNLSMIISLNFEIKNNIITYIINVKTFVIHVRNVTNKLICNTKLYD